MGKEAKSSGDVVETKEEQPKGKSKGMGLVNKGSNAVVTLILIYASMVANTFRGILWPKFPDIDPNTHGFITKHNNIFRDGDTLRAKLWIGTTAWPSKKPPLADVNFTYDWDEFKAVSTKFNVNVTQAQLKKGHNVFLSVEVFHEQSRRTVRAKGGLVKQMKKPDVREKFKLLERSICPEDKEPSFGKRTDIARGIPQMQVRLVHDTTAYPDWITNGPWTPRLFVDEFWLTKEQLVKLNTTDTNTFESEVHFSLMSAARFRFQNHMEHSFSQNAKLFGEDSEEMLQMRDLFANTNPVLLVVTLIVSVLHMIFEFLAFKNDVEFWQSCDAATLNKFVSVKSIAVGIIMQIMLLAYLWDESANILVLITSLASIVIDVWKVLKAMRLKWIFFWFIPLPTLESKVKREKADDFDSIAMYWLAVGLTPLIAGYGIYSLIFECHRGWYSFFLNFSASCVYSLGFILMTPQVFINYKHKTVAYLPWRKFVYRAITTFIDDLFAFIIRMPTMHRLSCFRDDIVFFIYLYQRRLYPVDRSRTFDEDGYEISGEETSGSQEVKKDK